MLEGFALLNGAVDWDLTCESFGEIKQDARFHANFCFRVWRDCCFYLLVYLCVSSFKVQTVITRTHGLK